MDISQNPLSNEALWIFYDRLLQRALQLERSLATPSDREDSVTDIPQRINPSTPFRQTDGNESSPPQDEQSSAPLDPDQRQVVITLSSSPARQRPPTEITGQGQQQDITIISSSSASSQTPAEFRIPVQPVRGFPSNLRNVPGLQTTRPQVLDATETPQADNRISITRETIDAYNQLLDSYMGVRYNISTTDGTTSDTSDDSDSEPIQVEQDVVSLMTANAYIDSSAIESTAYDITNLGVAREGNYYLGRFDFEGHAQRNRPRFPQRTWGDLVTKANAFGDYDDTAYPMVCAYLRTKRKLVLFVNISRHATVLTLVHRTRTATFFDTLPSPNNQSRAVSLCSSIIRLIFNETTVGWTLRLAPVGRQNVRANNCGIHSLLRIRDELEDNNQYDTNERDANTLRLYMALRGAYGEARYPLAGIIK